MWEGGGEGGAPVAVRLCECLQLPEVGGRAVQHRTVSSRVSQQRDEVRLAAALHADGAAAAGLLQPLQQQVLRGADPEA